MDPPWGSFVPALICLGLFTAARIAEQVRAGVQALPTGQRAAASALGFGRGGMYRLILLPQAFRIILPTLTNEFMTIFKNTSVALTIGLVELTATAREINENTFRTFEAYRRRHPGLSRDSAGSLAADVLDRAGGAVA